MRLGFSTGSLAQGDFRYALAMLEGRKLEAIELSALREEELPVLMAALGDLNLDGYQHVSLHAPSKLVKLTEPELAEILSGVELPIVMHPDVITVPELWRDFGPRLLIENMDKRKPVGRTAAELYEIFEELPNASLCLDVGHSRQIDPSLYETRAILRQHGHRLAEIHLSDVNSSSGHEPLNRMAIEAFASISCLIPADIPVILETPVSEDQIEGELKKAREIFAVKELLALS